MTELWLDLGLAFGLLLLPVAFVLLWPALRGAGASGAAAGSRRAALATLYREQKAELAAARASGALDECQFAELETEMARNLLAAEAAEEAATTSARSGRGLLMALALALPLLALGIYFGSDHYDDLALYRQIAVSQKGETSAADEVQITSALRARAESHPDDLTSRYVLAQRLMVSGDLEGAVESYRYVLAREPQAPVVKAELAQALFFVHGSKMTDEIDQLVAEVLSVQPDNGTALGLAGIAAFDRGDYRAARAHWQRALGQLRPGSAAAEALAAGVARAEKALADSGESLEQPQAETVAATEGPAIRVSVSLGEGVAAQPDTPVFIYARSADSPMPLAIVRLRADQLPAQVVLDKSRAMMPSRSIASVDSVQLVARLAVHGNARPASGDWQGAIESLDKSEWDQPVAITIDREL